MSVPAANDEAKPSTPSRTASMEVEVPIRTSASPTVELKPVQDKDGDGGGGDGKARGRSPSTSRKRASDSIEEDPASTSASAEASGSRAPQRRRVLDMGRGNRMFGLLNQTLSRAKQDEEKRNSGSAAKRRADLEARMASKREADSAEMQASLEAKAEAKRLERSIQLEAQWARKLAELIVAGDAEQATRKVQKRRLSAFLVTSGRLALEQGEALDRAHRNRTKRLVERGVEDEEGRVLDAKLLAETLWKEGTTSDLVVGPDVAMALCPPPSLQAARGRSPAPRDVELVRDAHPIYFLPKKLTVAQENRLDDQEDDVDAQLEKTDEEWKRRREALMGELDRVKERIREMRKGGAAGVKSQVKDKSDSEMKVDEPKMGNGAEEGRERADKEREQEGGSQAEDKDEVMADEA